jgi:hypothetical protein
MLSIHTLFERPPVIGLIFLFCSSLLGETTHAQTAPPKACTALMTSIVQDHVDPNAFADLRGSSIICFWELALVHVATSDALHTQAALQKRVSTIQTGAPSGINGTTSAVSKPFTPISLATEYGGITTSSSNQTMTLQAPLDGIPAALVSHGFVGYCWSPVVSIPGCVSASHLQWLNRFSVGVSANTTTSSQNVKGTASPSTTTAQPASLTTAGSASPSLASVFTKVNLVRGGGALTLPANVKQEGTAVNDAQEHIIQALRKLRADEMTDSSFNSWSACIRTQFRADRIAHSAEQATQFYMYWAQLVGILFAPDKMDKINCDSADMLTQQQIDALQLTMAQRNAWYGPWKKDPKTPIPTDPKSPQYVAYYRVKLIDAVDEYIAATELFEAETDKLVRSLAPMLSLEYDYNTPVNQPTTSTAKLLLSYATWKTKCSSRSKAGGDSNSAASFDRLTATVNVGGNFYNSSPSPVPSAGAFRDFQAGSEIDLAFCSSNPNPVVSFLANGTVGMTYYYQDQVSPSILKVASAGMPLPGINITGLSSAATQVFTKKGPINFIQLKYGFGLGKNVKFPIAVSWSNRTDLITHATWSAQFGVSYDFASLLNSSSGGSTP